MKIEFGVHPAQVNADANGVRFYALADGKKVNGLISEEALAFLEDPEGQGKDRDLLEVFEKHKDTIEKKAMEMIEAGYKNDQGEILIIESDVRE